MTTQEPSDKPAYVLASDIVPTFHDETDKIIDEILDLHPKDHELQNLVERLDDHMLKAFGILMSELQEAQHLLRKALPGPKIDHDAWQQRRENIERRVSRHFDSFF